MNTQSALPLKTECYTFIILTLPSLYPIAKQAYAVSMLYVFYIFKKNSVAFSLQANYTD
jgi:hypothetical protein